MTAAYGDDSGGPLVIHCRPFLSTRFLIRRSGSEKGARGGGRFAAKSLIMNYANDPRKHDVAGTVPDVPGLSDVDRLARSLPDVTVAVEDDRPVYQVGGKHFLLHRAPRKDAVDPETGERYEDVLMIMVEDLGVKEALLADESGAFFTTPHFNGYKAVLVRIETSTG